MFVKITTCIQFLPLLNDSLCVGFSQMFVVVARYFSFSLKLHALRQTTLFIFAGRSYCYCVDAAHFLHQQNLPVCRNLFMWTFFEQHFPLYACLHWGYPWLPGYNFFFFYFKIIMHWWNEMREYEFVFVGCATSVLVTSAGMGEMVMQVLVGSVSACVV